MRVIYNSNKLDKRDSQAIEAIMEEHSVHIHRHLWTAEEMLSGQEPFDFMVTNIPFEDLPFSEMARYYTLPKKYFYNRMYRQSFACLDKIHEQWPEMKVIVYSGADEEACYLAVREHNVSHLVRKGRYEVEFEIAEIMKVLAGEEVAALWRGNTAEND